MLLYFVIFVCLLFTYSKITNKKMQMAAPIVIIFEVVIIYFSGIIFNNYIYGNLLIILLGIFSVGYTINSYLKNKIKNLNSNFINKNI